jgi:hypothetical protein
VRVASSTRVGNPSRQPWPRRFSAGTNDGRRSDFTTSAEEPGRAG